MGLQQIAPFSEQSQSRVIPDRQETYGQVKFLQDKVAEQQEEIKQLRRHLRDLFEKKEDEIVALSYQDARTGEKSSIQESTFKDSKFSPGKLESAKHSYREVSNIH